MTTWIDLDALSDIAAEARRRNVGRVIAKLCTVELTPDETDELVRLARLVAAIHSYEPREKS